MPSGSYYERNRERWEQYKRNRESADRPLCAAEDPCTGREHAKGFCLKHYKRWVRHGVLYSPKALAGLRSAEQRSRDYYLAHREERLAYARNRREADLEAARAYERRIAARRAPLRRAYFKAYERALENPDADTVAFDGLLRNDPCCYCGSREEIQVDHITPIAAGGRNRWFNLTSACRRCNRSKSTDSLLAFLGR